MGIKIKRYLQSRYPEFSGHLGQLKTITRIPKRNMPLPEALVRVVTGQMLSTQAASTIYARIRSKAEAQRLAGSWQLDHDSLRACGLSGSKARTICEFGTHIGADPTALDHWFDLVPELLIGEIKQYKGMGDWTASIIALFYVGHEDIFPATDGSLQRAITLIQNRRGRSGRTGKQKGATFDPEKAAPYRSYLALYLWRAMDAGLLDQG